MILIASAAYIGLEFQAEMGVVLPCMLPIGNKKILEHQVATLKQTFPNEKIVLSIPESYQLTINERDIVRQLSIVVRPVPDQFSLAEAVLYVLNIENTDQYETIRVLHGDTLIWDLPTDQDVIAVAKHSRQYNWYGETLATGEQIIWAGFFAFSSRITLIRALAISKGDFVTAINRYREDFGIVSKKVQQWYDCGHINTYFEARASITTQRSFNHLTIADGLVTKSSDNARKISSEIYWFQHIPSHLIRFTPQFIAANTDTDNPSYTLEYLSVLPLNEIYVHGRNTAEVWQTIFKLLQGYFTVAKTGFVDCDKTLLDKIALDSAKLYRNKTLLRLQQFSEASGIHLDQAICYKGKQLGTITAIAEHCIEKTLSLPCVPTVMHGDLCFSNILFDVRAQRIKLIDPRGIDENDSITILGNQTYDLAKLAHSVIGMYDFIIAGRYELVKIDDHYEIEFRRDERLRTIQSLFLSTQFIDGLTTKRILPAVVLLFLSMLPLHSDRPDRQQAMLANAFRLYHDFLA